MTEKKLWEVWCADGETREDAARVKAADAEDAAVTFIQDWDADDGEYPVATGGHVDVWVAPADGSAEPECLRVRGECSPTYWVEASFR